MVACPLPTADNIALVFTRKDWNEWKIMKQYFYALLTLFTVGICGLSPSVCQAQWSADAGYSIDSITRNAVTDSSNAPSTLGSTYYNSSSSPTTTASTTGSDVTAVIDVHYKRTFHWDQYSDFTYEGSFLAHRTGSVSGSVSHYPGATAEASSQVSTVTEESTLAGNTNQPSIWSYFKTVPSPAWTDLTVNADGDMGDARYSAVAYMECDCSCIGSNADCAASGTISVSNP